jgi:hypothetical protein
VLNNYKEFTQVTFMAPQGAMTIHVSKEHDKYIVTRMKTPRNSAHKEIKRTVLLTAYFPVVLRWNEDINTPPKIIASRPSLRTACKAFIRVVLKRQQEGLPVGRRMCEDVLVFGKMFKYLDAFKSYKAEESLPAEPKRADIILYRLMAKAIAEWEKKVSAELETKKEVFKISLREVYETEEYLVGEEGEVEGDKHVEYSKTPEFDAHIRRKDTRGRKKNYPVVQESRDVSEDCTHLLLGIS